MINKTRFIIKQAGQSLQVFSSGKVCKLCSVLIFLVVFCIFPGTTVVAQDTTSAAKAAAAAKEIHSPRKATIYALVLPGSGQIYNRKYWKVPIVYLGFGTMIYFIHKNNIYYKDIKEAYDYVAVTQKEIFPPTWINVFPYPEPPNDYAKKYTESQLKSGMDYYRRNLEVSYIFTGVWYLLTVVDAVVDAHFFDYDINSDLSLKVNPWIPAFDTRNAYGFSGGLNLSLRF